MDLIVGEDVGIVGWGSALPPTVVTNAHLETRLDTSDEWIRERTGILERRIGGSTVSLAIEAGQRAMDSAQLRPADVDLLILATTSADQVMPSSATAVQDKLGLSCAAFDLNAACAGFVYALITGFGMARAGHRRVLVIGSDVLSQWVNWEDRTTAVLFGDGAGAVVIGPSGRPGLLGFDWGADGSGGNLLEIDHGDTLTMRGSDVFRTAVRAMVESASAATASAGCSLDDIALMIPHQANERIIDLACTRLGFPLDRVAISLDRMGNTSAGSIPLALVEAEAEGRLRVGDLVLLVGFGAGMVWGSAVIRWTGPLAE